MPQDISLNQVTQHPRDQFKSLWKYEAMNINREITLRLFHDDDDDAAAG